MSSTGDLRDHLAAVLEAAPEFPPGDRQYLADVFMRDLETKYQLVPRGQTPVSPARPRAFHIPWLPILAVLFVMMALPFVVWPLLHPPVLLFVLLIFLVARSAGFTPWRSHRSR